MRRHLKKLISSASYKSLKTSDKICLYDIAYYSSLEPLFEKIDKTFDQEATHFFKNSRGDTTTVACISYGDHQLVIKRYNFKNFWHALKLQFRKSHAFRSFIYANHLHELEINTIKPIAAIQKKWWFIKRQSYFVSEYLDGIKGCEYFRDEFTDKSNWKKTADGIMAITANLKKNQIYHGDYHFGNFVIVDNKPYLLDFDRIRTIKNSNQFQRLHNKDLANFQRYLRRNVLACEFFSDAAHSDAPSPQPSPASGRGGKRI